MYKRFKVLSFCAYNGVCVYIYIKCIQSDSVKHLSYT